jgi:magnesium chelatase subunit H
VKITVLYVGSSLLLPLRQAERDVNRRLHLGLQLACHNCTLPVTDALWPEIERDLAEAEIVFVIHITDEENAGKIGAALDRFRTRHRAVIVINCFGGLMRRMHMGRLGFSSSGETPGRAENIVRRLGAWMAAYAGKRGRQGPRRPERYLRIIAQSTALLRLIPAKGALGDAKHYVTIFCYFLQPSPANIRSMVLYAIKHYVPGYDGRIRTDPPRSMPTTGIYHPDAPGLFEEFDEFRKWYESRGTGLRADRTIGLLLLRPQVISGAHAHYDYLIRAVEAENLAVLPILATFMDNREACQRYLVDPVSHSPRVSQVLSLTGFSFVGGPAMNDSEAAVAYLRTLNRPFRSAVSLETQSVGDWAGSLVGLNAVQTAMQVAIPEVDGATEPFVFGGTRAGGNQPEPLPDRCQRIARRLARWNRLQQLPRSGVRLAFIIYCFPPNKGNLGTAADLDVFPSLLDILRRLQAEGCLLQPPASPDQLRDAVMNGVERFSAADYYRLCPLCEEIVAVWGPAPGQINALGRDILISGLELGNVFIGVQPTFGYEGDPMRLLMAQGGTPHHGFMALYTWLDSVFRADAVVHVGTHGALEFMPGKQAGLSDRCWPDRLIGAFPNLYVYSVNNPSEGSIAKRRSYAELISYLTPPMECAGLYKELAALKEMIAAYRQSRDERQRAQLFAGIEEKARGLKLEAAGGGESCILRATEGTRRVYG